MAEAGYVRSTIARRLATLRASLNSASRISYRQNPAKPLGNPRKHRRLPFLSTDEIGLPECSRPLGSIRIRDRGW